MDVFVLNSTYDSDYTGVASDYEDYYSKYDSDYSSNLLSLPALCPVRASLPTITSALMSTTYYRVGDPLLKLYSNEWYQNSTCMVYSFTYVFMIGETPRYNP